MEIPKITIKRQNEATRHSQGIESFSLAEELDRRKRAVDAAIIDLLDKKVGKSWRQNPEDVILIYCPNYDPETYGGEYQVLYKHEPVGIV